MRNRSIILASITVALGLSSSFAQLSSLDDSAVLRELARRNAGQLLERAFEVNKTPEDERAAMRAHMSLNELKRTDLSQEDRYALVRKVVAGLTDDSIKKNTDAANLFEQASLLVDDGVSSDINTLEYWGPAVTTQNRVKPVVEKAITITDRSYAAATDAMDNIVFRNADDKLAIEKSAKLEVIQSNSQLLRQQLNYYLSISLDVADPKRVALGKQGAEDFAAFDHDENPMRNLVRLLIGKFQMARMDKKGFDDARATFKSIIDSEKTPPPGVALDKWIEDERPNQFEARYFTTANEIFAGDIAAARKSFDALDAWQKQARVDPETLTQWQVAKQILEYRLLNLESQRGADAAARTAAKEKGTRILLTLIDQRPDLQDLILSQLMSDVDPTAPVEKLDVLLLKALVGEGEKQVQASELGQKVDVAVLKRGADAARELAKRPGIDPKLADNSAYREAVFLEFSGELVQAAGKYFDFAEQRSKTNRALADRALSSGQRVFAELKAKQPNDPEVDALTDRVYPISIAAPFNQKQYTFTYAVRLQRQKKYTQAADMFRSIKEGEEAYENSRYWLMRADEAIVAETTDDAIRKSTIAEISQLVPQVRTILQKKPASDGTRSQLAYTTLLGARIAGRDQNDPAKALELLKNFDADVAGLKEQDALLGDAIFLRVQSYMALNRVDEATSALLALIEKSGGQRGGIVVRSMLERLELEFEQAKTAGDKARMTSLQNNRAALTPKLVAWAETQTGPDAKRQIYVYRRYNAETQRLSADFLPNEADAKKRREDALKIFMELDSPAGLADYRATLTPEQAARARYDTAVALSLARLNYDLGNFGGPGGSQARFGRLAIDRALGLPVVVRREADGTEVESENDAYWEAIYKWIVSMQKENQPMDDQVKTYLKEQYVRWGARVGGSTWKKEFEQLRTELIPDFDPKSVSKPTTVPVN